MTRARVLPFSLRARLVAVVLAGLAAGLLALGSVAPASAQVQTADQAVEMPDPALIRFSLRVSGAPITSAVVNYQRATRTGSLGGSVDAEVPSRGTGVLTAELVTNGPRAYIPVGTRFTYHWTLRTEGGETIQTEPQQFVFLDGRFQWQMMEEGDVRVFWYADEALARSVLNASAVAVADMADLLEVDIDFPITVVLYRGTDDGRAAQQPRGGVYDEMARTGGTRVASDLVHVYDSLGLTWEDITRHEITHVITSAAGDGAFTSLPSWIDEGLATYAQEQKGGRVAAVAFAIQTDTTLRLRNLAAPTNRAELIELFYGQSWSTMEYLIDTYGRESVAELLASIKSGNTTDEALMEIYGFDQDGLYNEWRVANGLEPREFAPVAGGATTAQPQPTRAPLTLPTSVAGGSGSASGATGGGSGESSGGGAEVATSEEAGGGGGNAMTAAIVGLLTLAVAGGLGFFGFRMLRTKS